MNFYVVSAVCESLPNGTFILFETVCTIACNSVTGAIVCEMMSPCISAEVRSA
jgi:hypothetical protein